MNDGDKREKIPLFISPLVEKVLKTTKFENLFSMLHSGRSCSRTLVVAKIKGGKTSKKVIKRKKKKHDSSKIL